MLKNIKKTKVYYIGIVLIILTGLVMMFLYTEQNIKNGANNESITDSDTSIVKEDKLEYHFITVEKGESTYIKYENMNILIDVGSSEDGSKIVEYLKEQGVESIQMLFLTHMDKNHIGGINDIMKSFHVENIIDSGTTSSDPIYAEYKEIISNYDLEYSEDSDSNINISDNFRLRIIETGDEYTEEDNNSIVLLFDFMGTKVLFTGDMGYLAEAEAIEKLEDVDILKIANHGAKTSTSLDFLKKVNPEYGVIFTSKAVLEENPNDIILHRLKEHGVRYYRTDKDGTIILKLINDTIKWELENPK